MDVTASDGFPNAVRGLMDERGYDPANDWAWLALVGLDRPEGKAATKWMADIVRTVIENFCDQSVEWVAYDAVAELQDTVAEEADTCVPAYYHEQVSVCVSGGFFDLAEPDLFDWAEVSAQGGPILPRVCSLILWERALDALQTTVQWAATVAHTLLSEDEGAA